MSAANLSELDDNCPDVQRSGSLLERELTSKADIQIPLECNHRTVQNLSQHSPLICWKAVCDRWAFPEKAEICYRLANSERAVSGTINF
jgi:hypothetical protein